VRAGFQPIAADLFADADLRAIATTTRISPYPDGFIDWMRTVEPAAWMYTGALENHPELVDELAWIAPLWGNPGDVLQRVRNPWELAAALRNAGFQFPETRASCDGLPRDGSWLAKSCHGASGSGVRSLSDSHASIEAFDERAPLVYQRCIAGAPGAAAFATSPNGTVMLGVTRQLIGESWLGAHGFQFAGSIGPLAIDDETQKSVARLGQVLGEQFELAGVFGVDFILNEDGVWPIEVNPRYTASMEICERLTGISTLASHAGSWFQPEFIKLPSARIVNPELAHGKAILFARRDLRISQTFAEMSLAEALRTPWPTLADVSPAGTIVEAGRPILTLFAQGATVEMVEQHLRERVLELEALLYGGDPP
jgi:predicted ATP-grasp superfamily ATP-dependent carboligase